MKHTRRRRGCEVIFIILFSLLIFTVLGGVVAGNWMIKQASERYGIANPDLSPFQKIYYSTRLNFSRDELFRRQSSSTTGDIEFTIEEGESINSITMLLKQAGLIANEHLFQDLLVYAGLDTKIQAGTYRLDSSMSAAEIAVKLQDPAQRMVKFIILLGWRSEEIASAIPTSGLNFTSEELLDLIRNPSSLNLPAELKPYQALEGFLMPGEYLLDRNITASALLEQITNEFSKRVDPVMIKAFSSEGLNLYQAVTLASIVEREAMVDDEKPVIASVFLNRLHDGMKLDSDPTVQYAVGFDAENQSWWKNPLSYADLQIDSPYNTYIYPSLPPGPISNPGIESLHAVAYPQETAYYYFRAACDGSGRHLFAISYEEHLSNECP